MEAAPRLPMLSFELKTCNDSTQFGPQLKQVSVLENTLFLLRIGFIYNEGRVVLYYCLITC